MVMRHKPITPRRHTGRRRVDGDDPVVALSPDQREALDKWVNDFKKIVPELQRVAAIEQRLFQEMLDASTWQIAETEKPEWVTDEPSEWTVGHAKVNYVDKIDGVEVGDLS